MGPGFLERQNPWMQTDRLKLVDKAMITKLLTRGRLIKWYIDVLGRYKVDVAALQETKCFGEDEYRVGKCVVLAAGRSVPGPGVVNRGGRVLPLCYLVPQLVLGKKADVDGKPGVLGW